MGREWYPSDEGTWHCQVGVDWQYSSDANNVYIAPIIYRWDANNTNNSGSRFWETLSPDTNGSGSWSGYSWGSGSGTRQVASFASRTYSRDHSAYNVTLTIGWDSSFGTWYGGSFRTIGSGQHSWTISVPAKDSYTVSYNANGGSGAPSNQTKWYGENLTLSSTKPTKSGYKFVGWSTSSTATSASYSAGGTYAGNSALTLYAVWVQNTFTCTLHYDANGGTSAPADQTHVQKITSTISSGKPTRHGYVFLGWSADKNATNATYIANGRYSNDSFKDGDTITLYAVWTKAVLDTFVKVPDKQDFSQMYVKIPDGQIKKNIVETITLERDWGDKINYFYTSSEFTVSVNNSELVFIHDISDVLEIELQNVDTSEKLTATTYTTDNGSSGYKYTIPNSGKYKIYVLLSTSPNRDVSATLTYNGVGNPDLKAVWYNVEDLVLKTSNNVSLRDKNGNYLMAKGV